MSEKRAVKKCGRECLQAEESLAKDTPEYYPRGDKFHPIIQKL